MNHDKQRALCDAAWDGHHHIVGALLDDPEVLVGAHHSAALLHAAHWGHAGCVDLLLARSDAQAHRSEALLRAAQKGHRACVRLLLADSDTSQWYPHEWDAIKESMKQFMARCAQRDAATSIRKLSSVTASA